MNEQADDLGTSYASFKPEVLKESILIGSKALQKAPGIEGVPTGVEGLDDLFFTLKERNGKLEKISLKGLPKYSIFNITGVNDTGKSLMAEQFAVEQASRREKVVYITVESPANFVISSIKYRALAMGINFDDIQDNIVLIDAASYTRLRDNIPDLLATLAYTIKTYNVNYCIIDSVTGLFENKEMAARSTIRKLYNFMKKWYQTALFISQKRSSHEELSAEAAGGYAVGHILDGTMVLAKEPITSAYASRTYGAPLGEMVRLFRIDGCRMSGHDTKTHYMEITDTGLVKIKEPIGAKNDNDRS
ncbi:KaiC domain-containing protein [Hydrogenimonas sp.]